MAKSDAELIKQTLNGDETAFGFLIDKYKGAVHALAYRKLNDFHTAEEITQDTFLKAHRKLATLKDYRCFPGWLYVIAARCCISWKRRNRAAAISFDNVDMSRMQRLAWAKHTDARLHEDLHDALEALPESERTVLTLHYLGGLTYEEISRFIGASRQSIKNRLYRARIRLKNEMLPAMEETFSGFQLPPHFTQQLVRQIRDVKPTPTPSGKPIAPWIAGTSVVVIAIFGGLGRFHDTPSPMPNHAINREAVTQIYFAEAPAIQTRTEKPKLPGGVFLARQSDGVSAAANQSAELATRRGNISGAVTYKNSGKPAADVPIRAAGTAPGMIDKTAHTKGDGTYLLKNLIPGSYVVMIGDTWDWHRTFDWRAPAHIDIRVQPNETYSHVDFQLTSGAFIEGRVTDLNTGAPIEGIQIQIYDATHPLYEVGHRLDTDADGRYRFRVAPGPVKAFVHPRRGHYPKLSEESWQRLQPRAYPWEGGTISDVDFAFHPGITLVGVVKTPDNKPVEGALVKTRGLGGYDIIYPSTDKGGNFKLEGLPPNKGMAIIVEHAKRKLRGQVYVEQLSRERMNLPILQLGTEDFEFHYEPVYEALTIIVSDQVTTTSNKDTSHSTSSEDGSQIEPAKAYGHISGRVVYKDSGHPHAGMPIVAVGTKSGVEKQTRTDRDGKYTLADLSIDDYTVMIGDSHESHTTSMWRASAQKDIRISADETETGVNFQLTPGAIVEVSVTAINTHAPVKNVLIRVFDAGRPESVSQGHWARTDDQGRCSVRIAAGDFMVVADTTNTGYYITHDEQHIARDMEMQTIAEPMMTASFSEITTIRTDQLHHKITEGQIQLVVFECYRGFDVNGAVQTETGDPVSGALIETVEPSEFRAFTESADDGAFTLKGFPEGFAAGINVVVPGTELHGQGYFFAGQQTPLKIIVSREIRGLIVGRVIDENGTAMVGVGITLHSRPVPEDHLSSQPILTFRPVRPLYHTDESGGFVILPFLISVPAGWTSSDQTPSEELAFPQVGQEYQISTSAIGYQKSESGWIVLQRGAQCVPDLVLKKSE